MVKLVSELASASTNERSAEGGSLADASVRSWRVILDSPNEVYDIQRTVGVYIGDPHPVNTGVPCVSIGERADGDSRLVKIVTATYRTTPGSNQTDHNSQAPDVRPARFTISSTLMEVPAQKWRELTFNGVNATLGEEVDPLNPAKDRYDNVSVLTPVINISLDQYDTNPTTGLAVSGCVNGDDFRFLNMRILPFHCMLRGINVRPTVETWGSVMFRGFTRTYEFMVYPHDFVQATDPKSPTALRDGAKPSRFGFWVDQILEGFNIINDGLGNVEVDQKGLNLAHDVGKVVVPLALAQGTQGTKMRAVVPIVFPDANEPNAFCQRPSAQPVALNLDGTPRNVNRTNAPPGWEPVLRKKYVTAKALAFGNNFANLGIRVQEIL